MKISILIFKILVLLIIYALPIICYTVYKFRELKYQRVILRNCKINKLIVRDEQEAQEKRWID